MIASHAFKLRCHKNCDRLLLSFDAGASKNAHVGRPFDAPSVGTNGSVEIADGIELAFRRSPSATTLVSAGIGRGPAHSLGPNRWEIAAGGKATANTQVTGNGRSSRRSAPIATPERRIYALRHTHTDTADPQRLTPTSAAFEKPDALYCDARSHAVEADGLQAFGRRYDPAWMIPRRPWRIAARRSEKHAMIPLNYGKRRSRRRGADGLNASPSAARRSVICVVAKIEIEKPGCKDRAFAVRDRCARCPRPVNQHDVIRIAEFKALPRSTCGGDAGDLGFRTRHSPGLIFRTQFRCCDFGNSASLMRAPGQGTVRPCSDGDLAAVIHGSWRSGRPRPW